MEKAKTYLRETIGELRKMTWPSRQEVVGSTVVVVIVSFIVAIFIGAVDRLLVLAMRLIFGAGVEG